MKQQNRTERLMVRLKPSELKYLEREADERGQKLSEYVRACLLVNAVLIPSDGK